MEKVSILKLYNGDYIIGTLSSNDESNPTIVLNDPRSFIMMPGMTGELQVALRPICMPFNSSRLKKEIAIRRDQVLFILDEDEIDKEVVNGYRSEISGIHVASNADLSKIDVNSLDLTSCFK